MGAVGGLLGLNGGANGTGFSGPGTASIQTPTTVQQAQDQYASANNAVNAQAQFVNAVNAANGIGNQSSVFNQLQGVANGSGPNPAQAALAQATGANVANQAALMAGQRGSSANVGLMARQAAQQGANTQQQSAGQAATMQANQSLNALGQMGSLATNQANQQANALQAYNQAAQGEQGQVLGSIAAQNNANVGMQSNINSSNAGLASSTMGLQGSAIGGLASGLAAGAMMAAEGGKVPMMAQGGSTPLNPAAGMPASQPNAVANFLNQPAATPTQSMYNGMNSLGKLAGSAIANSFSGPSTPTPQTVAGGPMDSMSSSPAMANSMPATMAAAKGGKVPALVSPGEQYIPPKEVKEVAKGKKDPLKAGERIPGKPKFPGNDYRNDVVPKKLDEGGIVIPNEIMQSKNPHWEAMKFVQAHMAKGGMVSAPKKAKK